MFLKLGIRLLSFLFFLGILISCNDLVKDETVYPKGVRPTRIIRNAHFTVKESGWVKLNLESPLIFEFGNENPAHTIFPKGLRIDYYTKNHPKPGLLEANWAFIIEEKGYYLGKKGVRIINPDGDTLRSKSLQWLKESNEIKTTDTVIITRKNGTFIQANHGLISNSDFTEYTLYKNSGVLTVDP